MPAFLSIGFMKADQVNNGSSFSVGQNIIQNRNSTKQNLTSISVGDSLTLQPIGSNLNLDTDGMDQTSMDAADVAAPQG